MQRDIAAAGSLSQPRVKRKVSAALRGGRLLIAAGALGAAAGCSQLGVLHVAPGDSQADVRRVAGPPSQERTLADGTTAWFYVYGPSAWTTYRVRFKPNDGVMDSRQVLTARDFQDCLLPGKTTRERAGEQLGPPGLVMRFPNLGEEVWTYRWMDVTLPMKNDVHFDLSSGLVKSYQLYWDPCPYASLMCAGT